MVVLFIVVFVILDHSLKANLMREVDGDLAALQAAYYIDPEEAGSDHEAKEIIDGRLRDPAGEDAYLLQRGGKSVAGNIPPMTPRLGSFFLVLSTRDGPHTVWGRGAFVTKGAYAFVGRDLEQVQQAEAAILRAFAVVFLASLLLATLSGLALSRSFLNRIDAVAETCHSIMTGKLSERIPTGGKDGEFERLGATINAMLDRIQVLMESLRQVSTDIAHDMRTPLAHLRQKLERARDNSSSQADYAHAVEGAIEDCDQLLTVFSALLRIAQIEAGAKRAEFAPIDLKDVAAKAGEIYAPVMEDNGHHFSLRLAEVPRVAGDHQLLMQLVTNLLDNAISHTPPGTDVVLSLASEAGSTLLTVADNGPGVPQSERGKILRRFYRGEQSRSTPGCGLGLALAEAVAELHGAELIVADNAPGLRVTLRF